MAVSEPGALRCLATLLGKCRDCSRRPQPLPSRGCARLRAMSVVPCRPWHEAPLAALRGVAGVLTDIDDTLTTDGAITADALGALADLRAAGLPGTASTTS